MREFQFLGRNSGRSDATRVAYLTDAHQVSIPRSEFWSFGLRPATDQRSGMSPGFQFLGRNSGRSDPHRRGRHGNRARLFQFLGRNSGRSDKSGHIVASIWR